MAKDSQPKQTKRQVTKSAKRGLNKLTILGLKQRLKAFGETVSGTKPQLLKRLRKHSAQIKLDSKTVHKLKKGGQFWRIEVLGSHTITTAGKIGTDGKVWVSVHKSPARALSFLRRRVSAKIAKEYILTSKKVSVTKVGSKKVAGLKPSATKKAVKPTAAPAAPAAVSVKPAAKRSGPKASAPPSPAESFAAGGGGAKASGGKATKSAGVVAKTMGVVEPSCAFGAVGGSVYTDSTGIYDCLLTFLDLSQNVDKFFTIQVVEKGGQYVCFNHWGRTGTAGQSQTFGPFSSAGPAIENFKEKFKEKTGMAWADKASFVRQPNKYDFMLRDYLAIASKKKSKWQYYVDDGVDGKPNGWYDYATEASDVVEGVHDTYLVNPANYNIRCVQSGHFMYQVDLSKMTQTNIQHSARKQRQIRRVEV